jgi:hypothetical protein
MVIHLARNINWERMAGHLLDFRPDEALSGAVSVQYTKAPLERCQNGSHSDPGNEGLFSAVA